MDANVVGSTIARLRKSLSMTQAQLANELNVSAKTISKWENGLGFPEVLQFPKLAKLFGVTVDYIMLGSRRGITIAGNMIADIVKRVDCYPEKGMLANITAISCAVGGCVPNTAIDLSVIDRSVPVSVLGRIGDDEHGRFLLYQLSRHGIDTESVRISANTPTSFCDVMSLPTGERTFFHARGANAEFCPEDVDISSLQCSILHIGYVHLLDAFDAPDEEYGTVMARFLKEVQAYGIKTSFDVVSDSTADYNARIVPVLKYTDYAILNEIESCSIWGFSPRKEDGSVHIENIRATMEKMAECGVREKVIVHCKEAGFCLDVETGEFTIVTSLNIPTEEIKGSVGAGDAYCAGCLYGLYKGYTDKQTLEFASAAAACNLFAENSVDGMKNASEIEKLPEKYGRKEI